MYFTDGSNVAVNCVVESVWLCPPYEDAVVGIQHHDNQMGKKGIVRETNFSRFK